MNPRKIDHIVYCVPDLEKEIENLTVQLGVRPMIGGRHITKGTKNALLHLGQSCYLEILAIDETNHEVTQDRWMGVDLITLPKVTRWSLKSEHLNQDSQILKKYHRDLGEISGGQRQVPSGKWLKWNMILPLATPQIDLLPFMTDWSESDTHPTDALEERCQLERIEFYHPDPEQIQKVFLELGINHSIVKSPDMAISVFISCPNGIVKI